MKIFPHPEIVLRWAQAVRGSEEPSGSRRDGERGRTIFETSSILSGDIKVVGNGPQRRLVVGGLSQSVSVDLPEVWEKVWGQLLDFPFEIKQNPAILALGLGGATTLHLASRKYAPRIIQAVEIDPTIIVVAKNYFNLELIPNLLVVNEDAVEYLRSLKDKKFDLVIVDIYLGQEFPAGANGEDFYGNIKCVLRPGGAVSINRIFYDREVETREKFRQILSGVFASVREKVLPGLTSMKNYLYFAQS